jgi:hypothetical protein
MEEEHSVKISYDNEEREIYITALNEDRITHYGFGSFLENINPKEILISKGALESLLQCPERRGLQGLEFWEDNRLAWGSPSPKFAVHLKHINCPEGAKSWLKDCDVYEE